MIPVDLSRYLAKGERLLWQGKPDSSVLVTGPQDIVLIPFSLAWGGFALFWNISVWNMGAPFFFKIFGLPFLIVGAYMVFGRFFFSAYKRKDTQYAITNIRALIIKRGVLKEMPITPSLGITSKSGTSGSITLGKVTPALRGSHTSMGVWNGESGDFSFSHLADTQAAYAAIKSVQNGTTED
ncbi:MAG: hypothetical protein ACPG5U_01625 [Planktomarina sp.]